ncbi:MAG: transcriptional regulator [Cyanobacteria bacterium J06592_8]
MSSSKLSDTEKQEIIHLYQQVPEETTITLADRYGVSSSTVRRVLQAAIAKDIYDTLTQQKQRLHRTGKRSPRHLEQEQDNPSTPTVELESESLKLEPESTEEEVSSVSNSSGIIKRRRKRSSASDSVQESDLEVEIVPTTKPTIKSEDEQSSYSSNSENIELLAEDFLQEEYSEFEQEEEEEEDYLEVEADDEEENRFFASRSSITGLVQVQILPLAEAELPKTCYLVIDRAAELVAKPLKSFSELGEIPSHEIHEKTLPVFDNHRVASRFSDRNQRVFKVPDSRLLQKVAPCLQAKGITRLLIDGQVYRF